MTRPPTSATPPPAKRDSAPLPPSAQDEQGSSGADRAASPASGLTASETPRDLESLDPSRWEVSVRVDGEDMLTIGSHGYLAGYSEIDRYGDAIRAAAEHLASFIGTGEPVPCFACDGSGQERWVGYGGNEEVGPCPVCGDSPEDQELPI